MVDFLLFIFFFFLPGFSCLGNFIVQMQFPPSSHYHTKMLKEGIGDVARHLVRINTTKGIIARLGNYDEIGKNLRSGTLLM